MSVARVRRWSHFCQHPPPHIKQESKHGRSRSCSEGRQPSKAGWDQRWSRTHALDLGRSVGTADEPILTKAILTDAYRLPVVSPEQTRGSTTLAMRLVRDREPCPFELRSCCCCSRDALPHRPCGLPGIQCSSDTDAAPVACQSPFWKKFREALVINPESTSGNPVSLLCSLLPCRVWGVTLHERG